MASSLNSDAPMFFPSGECTIAYSHVNLSPVPNPNPSYISFPYFITPYNNVTSLYYVDTPPPLAYLYSAWHTSFQLVVQPFVPSASPSAAIQELENSDRDNTLSGDHSATTNEQAAVALVHNRHRVVAPREVKPFHNHDWRQGPAFTWRPRGVQQNFEISNDTDFAIEGKTTVMIKNLPVKFNKDTLLKILREHCVEQNRQVAASAEAAGDELVLSEFDFFYLPMDFRTGNNKGYAFVNFTSPVGACRLHKYLHNHWWLSAGSNKVCQVNFASIQGLSKLIERNERIHFPSSVPDDFMPIHFEPPCNGLNEPVEYLIGVKNNF